MSPIARSRPGRESSSRPVGSSFLNNAIVRNPWVWGALAASSLLVVAAVLWSPLASVLGLENPGAAGWRLALGMSLVSWALGQIRLGLAR